MSAQRARSFTATDSPEFTHHARRRWEQRGDPAISVEQAWREATPQFCGIDNARFERLHEPTGCTLVAYRIHSGVRASVVVQTVLAPDQEPRSRWMVTNLLPEGGGES